MKTKTFNVSMPEDLVNRIDLEAKKLFMSRSAFLRMVVISYLQKLDQIENERIHTKMKAGY